MTMPHSPVAGMPSTPGNAPVYPGTVPGTDYADMQPAPQVAAPPRRGLAVASICLGVIGIILCAIGLLSGLLLRSASFSPSRCSTSWVGL